MRRLVIGIGASLVVFGGTTMLGIAFATDPFLGSWLSLMAGAMIVAMVYMF